jgi:hypothetical protein
MSTQVLSPEFRVAFPKVFKAERNDLNGKDEFSVVALFAKGADLSKMKAAAKAAAEKKWGADPKKWPKNLRDPFRDQGDREKEDDDGNAYLPAGYEKGAFYLNLKSTKRPGLVDAKVQDIIDETDFYGGCYARAQVNAFAYDSLLGRLLFWIGRWNETAVPGLGNPQRLRLALARPVDLRA